ncbi:hypothetical protein ETAE_0211 [Edwardsiella piscicida]|uniref:Uncharacterized protein n=2 Tax=Edwardsiella TaxID=635 RepID=A0A0H3DP33_EDWTF|nr:hypothetical protein ETAE_0211 [Edwardsiella tarda EIB202]ADM40305.1 hypothetical protein ETAF_0182 [Edwardsiella tarda FL6-60]
MAAYRTLRSWGYRRVPAGRRGQERRCCVIVRESRPILILPRSTPCGAFL